MRCESCGAENQPGARFCASCGVPVTAVVRGFAGARSPMPSPLSARAFASIDPSPPMAAPQLLRCPHCGAPAAPVPYFSRGFNVAKAASLLIPFSFVGPIFFFILRKDRMICGACRSLLSHHTSAALLQAASGPGALASWPSGGALVYEGGSEGDPAMLEHRSQRQRRRAWTWGTVAAGLVGFGVMTTFKHHPGDITGFLVAATPPGLVAAIAAFRSRALGLLARTTRARQRRLQVLELARRRGGRLNVSYVAAELRIELTDAEELLGSMVDGQRVEMEVDDDGRISYVFTELRG